MNTLGGSYTKSPFGRTLHEDNILPSPPPEGILEETKPQVETSEENRSSNQELSQGFPNEKIRAASHDQLYNTDGDDLRSSKDKEQQDVENGEENKGEISEEVSKYGHYLRMMGKQMIKWEKEIQKQGLKQDYRGESKVTKDKYSRRHPAIPEISRVAWTEFKSQVATDKRYFAIEVLVGEPRFYYQRRKDEKEHPNRTKSESDLQEEVNEEILLPMSLASIPYKEVPERIRINSLPTILILSDIASETWITVATTVLKPYKILHCFEKEIRQALGNLEKKWADVEKSQDGERQSQLYEMNTEKDGFTSSEHVKPARMVKDPGNHPLVKPSETTINLESEKCKVGKTSGKNQNETTQVDKRESPNEVDSAKEGKAKPTAAERMDSVEALRDMRCLVQFIDTYLKPQWQYFSSGEYHKVRFADLWHIFKPGDDVFVQSGAQSVVATDQAQYDQAPGSRSSTSRNTKGRSQTVWRLMSTADGRPYLSPARNESVDTAPKQKQNPFQLACYYIDFDGEKFGAVMERFNIKPFQGEKDINSLEIYPLRFAKDAMGIRERLRDRGMKFCEFRSPQHRYYTGLSVTHQPSGVPILDHRGTMTHPENIASQVFVDTGAAIQEHPRWFVGFNPSRPIGLDHRYVEESYPIKVWKDQKRKTLLCQLNEMVYEDETIDIKLTDSFMDREPSFRDDWAEYSAATGVCNNDLILLPARIWAYSFRNKKFLPLNVNLLRPTKPRKDGFNSLKLPAGYKTTVQALVQSHFSTKVANQAVEDDDYDFDLVRGKGKGLIILLHGAPGVGKTSTAECVAETHGKPLFPITCGDLGLVAEEVEAKLARIFHLAEQWDCVLLLDEADIFLAERTRNDLKRNSLVSVFLRVLEYYTGLLLLTSNRVGSFDPAFKSRIHMHLYYPPLRVKQTCSIWEMNLERTLDRKKTLIADKKEIMDYALDHFHKTFPLKANWNGRQIRNAFQTATALAEYDSISTQTPPRLDKKYFDIVAKASLDFDQYMAATHIGSDADRAYQNMERNDDFKYSHLSNQYHSHEHSGPLAPHYSPQAPSPYAPASGARTPLYGQGWPQDPGPGPNEPPRFRPPTNPTMVNTRGYPPSQQHAAADQAYRYTPPGGMPPPPPQASVNEAVVYREESVSAHPGGPWPQPQVGYYEPGPYGMGQGMGPGDDDYE